MEDVLSSPLGGGAAAPLVLPRVDDCQYRFVSLENGLKALVVSDPSAEKAAVACDVRVGSMSDPENTPGLAHFTEHMLFYSSDKYPVEDEYSKFISDHGGQTNAYTSNESTNYHFAVNAAHLEPAMDRFAQFFIGPRFSADGVEREANAVDSEHGKNVHADSWRRLQLWRGTGAAGHPFSRFSTGTFDTLITAPRAAGVVPHEAVRAFHGAHYSAGVMRVVVVGPQALGDLEAMVVQKFGAVADTGATPPVFSPDAVTAAEAGRLIRVVPEREGHAIELQWPTVAEAPHYREAPTSYLSHLLGHEGEGSAFAELKARGWATGLVAGGASTSYSSRSFFMVRVDLTAEGQGHVAEAVAVIFRYLDLLRGPGGVSEATWAEVRGLAETKFHYRDKQEPYAYASSLSHCMQTYDDADLLLAMYGVPLRYDPALIAQVLADLTPDACRVLWAAKELEPECTEVERWYGTKHSVAPIPSEWMSLWREGPPVPGLHLPAPNPFIPKDFGLVADSAPAPAVIHTTEMVRLWHRPDPSFGVPKACLYLHLQLPESYLTPEAAVHTQLYCRLLNDYLTEATYPADLAGLHWGLRATTAGLLLSLYGFTDALPALARTVLGAALGFEVRPDRFAVVKEKAARDFANSAHDQPYSLALYEAGVLTEAGRWHVDDYKGVLPGLTADSLGAFVPRLLSRCGVEAFASGSISAAAATALVQHVEAQLREAAGAAPPLASQAASARVAALRPGRPARLSLPGPNPTNDNSAVAVLFQGSPGDEDLRANALAELLTHVGKRDAFYQLRTVEQLGYCTWFTCYCTLTVRNVAFVLQSTAHGAAHLESRVEAFLPKLGKRLEEMKDEEFDAQVAELCCAKLEKPKRLRELAARDWREIDDGTRRFDRPEAEVAALRALRPEDLARYFQEAVLSSTTRRKLTVRFEGHRQPAAEDGGADAGVGSAAAAAEGAAAPAAPAAAEVEAEVEGAGAGEAVAVEEILDCHAWRRAQHLYPSSK